jgi:hypothetical protein
MCSERAVIYQAPRKPKRKTSFALQDTIQRKRERTRNLRRCSSPLNDFQSAHDEDEGGWEDPIERK